MTLGLLVGWVLFGFFGSGIEVGLIGMSWNGF